MNPRRVATLTVAAAIAIAIATSGAGTQPMGQSATYQVIFVPTWNPATHPADYPLTHDKKGLLTPMIGATHGADYRIFAEGSVPTPGLERLSEMGAHEPLDAEINAAIASGKAGHLIELSEGSEGPVHPPVMATFQVDRTHSRVSLVGMIAPSPDWFFGVSNLRLFRNGHWVRSVQIQAHAMDSGGDAGTTYMAEDADESPKKATTLVNNAYFSKNAPVGTFVFKLVPTMTES